jgi:hypothetical protein
VSLMFGALIAGCVAYLTMVQADTSRATSA